MSSRIDILLRQAGVRITPIRRAVLSALTKQKHPISVDELRAKMSGQMGDRVTMYRTLESLTRAGVVRTVDLRHGHVDYELNDPNRHHHHFVCESCGDVQHIRLPGEAQFFQKIERRHAFKTRSHSLELFGLCRTCQ